MKKIFRFFRKKKKPPSDSEATAVAVTSAPIASAAALPSPSLTSITGYKVRSKELSELHLAAATGDLEKLQELSKKHDLNQCDEANRTPLHFACANGRIDVATFLVRKRCKLNICDNDNRTPLMKAVQCQQESCAVYLLNHGADCNLVDAHGNTALHLAASTSCIPIAQELLDNFADTEAQNKGGSTPLFLAVAENSKEMTEFLLANGADINARDYEGRTPLMMAISYGNRELANLLLLHGAEIFLEDDAGRSAEDYALISGDLTLREKISECANLRKKEFSDRIKEALSIYGSLEDTGFMWGAPATNKEVVDDHSSGESLRSSGNPDDDSWLSSEEEDLDFRPKKVQKRSMAQLMNISQLCKEKNTLAVGMYEEEENCAESPWDSESISESPGKPIIGFLPASPAKASTHMCNISEETCNGKSDGSQLKTTQANVEQGISASQLLKGTESKEKPESDIMEELGIDDADDIEDTSDWDSPSVSLKSVPCSNDLVMEDHASVLQLAISDAVSKMFETIPTKGEEMSDAQPITALTGPQCNEQVTQKVERGENEVAEGRDQEKELLHKNKILEGELSVVRLELDQLRLRHREEEAKYLEENEALKEETEGLKKKLKMYEGASNHTVFQNNGQRNVSKENSAMLSSKLEHIKENKEKLEVELESFRFRLNSAIEELEKCQISSLERPVQQERDEWLRLKDTLNHDLHNPRQTNNAMSQQLIKAESHANNLENELRHVTHTLQVKNLLLESIQRDLSQAQSQVKELEKAQQGEKYQINKYTVKHDSMQERLAQLQSENLLPQQQFEDFQNKDTIKEKVVTDVQDRFNDISSKVKSDIEKQVEMVEARNKELITKCNHLREQVFKYETEKVEREGAFRRLQQELANSLKKQSTSEASLDIYWNDLEEDNQQLQRELHRIKYKVDLLSHQLEIQSARCTRLESANCDLQKQLLSMKQLHRNYEKLENSEPQLEEEVAHLKHHIQSNLMDQNQIQQYKRDIGERERQGIKEKLQQIKQFLQVRMELDLPPRN